MLTSLPRAEQPSPLSIPSAVSQPIAATSQQLHTSELPPQQEPLGPVPGPSQTPVLGPALGPSLPSPSQLRQSSTLPDPDDEADLSFLNNDSPQNGSAPTGPPKSPYTATRTLLRDLTLPAVPNLDIPPSPGGTPPPGHDALTSKFEHFLQLKRTKGVHFNQRLADSKGMRNPAMMDRLLGFVGVETEIDFGEAEHYEGQETSQQQRAVEKATEQYATVLSREVWDPHGFPVWAFRGGLKRLTERTERERARKPGEPVEFVSASSSNTGSAAGTGAGGGEGSGSTSGTPGVGGVKRKGRWD